MIDTVKGFFKISMNYIYLVTILERVEYNNWLYYTTYTTSNIKPSKTVTRKLPTNVILSDSGFFYLQSLWKHETLGISNVKNYMFRKKVTYFLHFCMYLHLLVILTLSVSRFFFNCENDGKAKKKTVNTDVKKTVLRPLWWNSHGYFKGEGPMI